jgi:hypothetical protein
MTHGLRIWGNDPHGEAVFIVGAYEHLSDIIDRLLGTVAHRVGYASPYAGKPISNAIYCLDAKSVEVAAYDMNQIAPIFEVSPQEALGLAGFEQIYERNCFFRESSSLAEERGISTDESDIPGYVWEAVSENRCGGLNLLDHAGSGSTYYSAICQAEARIVVCADQDCRVVAPDSSDLPAGLDLQAEI